MEKLMSWNDKYKKENGSVFVAPQISWAATLNLLGIEKENNNYKKFNGKKITDIWSWLGWFIFEIENSCDHINAVDPLYGSYEKEELLARDKRTQKNRIEESTWFLNNHKTKAKDITNQLNDLFLLPPTPRNLDEISYLEKEMSRINSIKKWVLWKKEILSGLEQRETRWFDDSNKIKLIWSSGENTWIESNSQDYVFIKHLINKDVVNSKILLNEALRITKLNWKIFIIDNEIKDELTLLNGLNYILNKKNDLILIEITK